MIGYSNTAKFFRAKVMGAMRIWLFVLLLIPLKSQAQWHFQGQLENGLARFKNKEVRVLSRARFNLGQAMALNQISFKWNVYYQPEIFNFSTAISDHRLKGQLQFNLRYRLWNWRFNFQTRYMRYRLNAQWYRWQSSNFMLNGQRQISKKILWNGRLILWYRDSKDFDWQGLNSFIVQQGAELPMGKYWFYLGVYFENFNVRSYSTFPVSTNSGSRTGFSVALNRSSKQIFSLNYDLLYHQSKMYKNGFWEHQVNFFWGQWLTLKWSLFLFATLTKQCTILKTEAQLPLYNPINHANHLYLKLGRNLNEKSEFYFKIGFEDERLIRSWDSWQYWQALLGYSHKF